MRKALVAMAILGLWATPAWAQDEPEPEPDPEGEEVDLDDFEPLEEDGDAPGGSAENPNAPKAVGLIEDDSGAEEKPGRKKDVPYPTSVAQRPLTLYAGMSEVAVDVPIYFDPLPVIAPSVRADYGVTREVQLGLRYGAGALVESEYVTGKAVAVEALYQIEPWIAAQLAVPINLDPFALAVEAGAPLLFRFDDFALFAGRDFLAVRIDSFIPVVENAAVTEGLVAASDIETELPDAEIRVTGGVIYQLKPNLALTAETGVVKQLGAPNASNSTIWPLDVTLTLVQSENLDVGGRVFVDNFNDFEQTAGIAGFAALRI